MLTAPVSQAVFDSLEQSRTLAKLLINMIVVERQKQAPNHKWIKDLVESAARILKDIVPYETARVREAVDLTFPQLDLSKATDAQLAALEALVTAIAGARSNSDGAGETSH